MGTLITQSTLELQFVLAETPEFSGYFERWQDAYETFERIVHLLADTDFGVDLVPLMSVAMLKRPRHSCLMEPYVSEIEEGYLAISEGKLIHSRGTQSFGQFLHASIEKEGISLESCPCCGEQAEIQYANHLVSVPPFLIPCIEVSGHETVDLFLRKDWGHPACRTAFRSSVYRRQCIRTTPLRGSIALG
jgi:hypothetical protein